MKFPLDEGSTRPVKRILDLCNFHGLWDAQRSESQEKFTISLFFLEQVTLAPMAALFSIAGHPT
jgi:hypothetical protein